MCQAKDQYSYYKALATPLMHGARRAGLAFLQQGVQALERDDGHERHAQPGHQPVPARDVLVALEEVIACFGPSSLVSILQKSSERRHWLSGTFSAAAAA